MHEVEKKQWSNGKWIGCGCGGCALLLILLIAGLTGLGGLAFFGLKQTDAYAEALARARANPEVIAALGEPIEAGLLVSGSIQVDNERSAADLSIPISGPDGDGTIYATAEKLDGIWTFSRLEVLISGTGERIDLLAEPLVARGGALQVFLTAGNHASR